MTTPDPFLARPLPSGHPNRLEIDMTEHALSVRRTWIVREGRDGRALFCVYAASMSEALRSASKSLDRIGVTVAFTVHAAPAQQLPDSLTSGRNVYAAAFEALPAA